MNWRYQCPEEHTSWRTFPENPADRRYQCLTCDEYYATLLDAKTNKLVTRWSA